MNIRNEVQAFFHEKIHVGVFLGLVLLIGWIGFEIWNFSTTALGLETLVGDLFVDGISATLCLAFALCFIDVAGIARVLVPLTTDREREWLIWLFLAWFIVASANAVLTWWVIASHLMTVDLPVSPVSAGTIRFVAPILIALITWLCRVSIIVTISMAEGKLFAKPSKTSIIGSIRVGSAHAQGVNAFPAS